MNRPSPTRYSRPEARARFDKTLNDAGRNLSRLLKMTATKKRRALKKRPSKPELAAKPVIEYGLFLPLLFPRQRRSDALDGAGRLRIAAEMNRWLPTK
jgi:hypothetical protein